MRWDDLFDDLDRQFEVLTDAAEDAQVAEEIRLEFGRVSLTERLTGALGTVVRLRLAGTSTVTGRLAKVGPDWLLIEESGTADVLVARSAVATVERASLRTGLPLDAVGSRFDLRKGLRAVARDRAAVTVHTGHSVEIAGTIDRVGHDFIEVAAHAPGEVRRAGAVRGVVLIPLATLVMVRSVPLG
jgi:hypothetical protein